MVLQPVGPEPSNVYWRRRAVLIVVAVLVLLVLLRACASIGGGSDDPETPGGAAPASTSPADVAIGGGLDDPSDDPSPGASGPGDPADAGDPAGTPAATSTPAAPAADGICRDSDLSVTVGTDASSYRAGATPRLVLKVTNTSSASCRRDLGSAALSLVVSSGPDRVWSSDDCSPAGKPAVRALAAGGSVSSRVTWSGKRSAKGQCGPNRKRALPGTYAVTAKVGTATSAAKRFILQ